MTGGSEQQRVVRTAIARRFSGSLPAAVLDEVARDALHDAQMTNAARDETRYAIKIAYRRAIDAIRHDAARRRFEAAYAAFLRCSRDDAAPGEAPVADEMALELRLAISRALISELSPRERRVFRLIALRGLSPAIVAERLGVARSTVDVLHHRARIKLAAALAEYRDAFDATKE